MTGAALVEVGPRDGLQNEAAPVPTAAKVAFIDALGRTGLTRIEVTAFVSPTRVPALADADEVARAFTRAPGIRYSALVPNEKGLERAVLARLDEVAVFTAASETFNRRNINASIAESLARFEPVMEEARRRAIPVRGYVSTAFFCPFEGRIAPAAAVNVTRKLVDAGCFEVSIGDTIGRATPKDVRDLLAAVRAEGLLPRVAGHFHDTYGMGVANVLAAFEAGVTTFDSSAGGLGGCPFAPGATGNVATEDVAFLFQGLGVPTGVDPAKVAAATAVVAPAIGRPLDGRAYRALRKAPPRAENPA